MGDRDDWLAWRRGGIGGSDIAAILGLSSFASPWTVWADKCGLLTPSETTERQQIGLDLEEAIARMFHRRTGLYVIGEQTGCTHPERTWMRATVDSFAVESPNSAPADAVGVGQWKTDARRSFPDGVPASMRAQVQWEMAVTGLPKAWLAVLHAGFRFEVYEVDRDDDDIAFMVERADEFWHRHVLPGIPPPVDGSDATDAVLAELYPGDRALAGVDLPGGIVAAWRAARDQRIAAAKAEQGHAQQLKAALGDATEGHLDGQLVVSWRPQTARRLSHELLDTWSPDEWPELHAVLRACSPESPSRVLRAHEPKKPKKAKEAAA